MNDKKFYEKVGKFAHSINPYAMLCQCHWETKEAGLPWRSELFLKANNGAGIKVWSGWLGETYIKEAWEQSKSGKKYSIPGRFCKYPTIDAFVANYVLKIVQAYPKCVERRDSFWGYFDGLFLGKYGAWATDLNYFRRLSTVAVELAPAFFGETWKEKLITSLEYAVRNKIISQEREVIARHVISQAGISENNDDKPVYNIPKEEQKIIFLDYGHGGRDGGAAIPGRNDISEKHITLAYGQLIAQRLSTMGYGIALSRSRDEYVSLSERARMAEKYNPLPSAFLSIHANSATSTLATGIEIFTYFGQDEGDVLATFIINSIKDEFPGVKIRADYSDGDVDKEANFAVLRETPNIPSALLELGFLTNKDDLQKLLNSDYQKRMAKAVAGGINKFVGGCA